MNCAADRKTEKVDNGCKGDAEVEFSFSKMLTVMKKKVCNHLNGYAYSLAKPDSDCDLNSGDASPMSSFKSFTLGVQDSESRMKRRCVTRTDERSSMSEMSSNRDLVTINAGRHGRGDKQDRESIWHKAAEELYESKSIRRYGRQSTRKMSVNRMQSTNPPKETTVASMVPSSFETKSPFRNAACMNRMCEDNIETNSSTVKKVKKQCSVDCPEHCSSGFWRKAAEELCKTRPTTNRAIRKTTYTADECNTVTRDNGNNIIITNNKVLNDRISGKARFIRNLYRLNEVERVIKEVKRLARASQHNMPLISPTRSKSCVELSELLSATGDDVIRNRRDRGCGLGNQVQKMSGKNLQFSEPADHQRPQIVGQRRRVTAGGHIRRLDVKSLSDQQVLQIFKSHEQNMNKRVMTGKEGCRVRLKNLLSVNDRSYGNSRIARITTNPLSKSENEINKIVARYNNSSLNDCKLLIRENNFVDGVGRIEGDVRKPIETGRQRNCTKGCIYPKGDLKKYTSNSIEQQKVSFTCNPAFIKSLFHNSDRKMSKSNKNQKNAKEYEERGQLYPNKHVPVFRKDHHQPQKRPSPQPQSSPERQESPARQESSSSAASKDSKCSKLSNVSNRPASTTAEETSSTVEEPPPKETPKKKKSKEKKPAEKKPPPEPEPERMTIQLTPRQSGQSGQSGQSENRGNSVLVAELCMDCGKNKEQCKCFQLTTKCKEDHKPKSPCMNCAGFKMNPDNALKFQKLDASNDGSEPGSMFCCCCQPDCSFKESLKRMFCISLPSSNSSETRCCFKRNNYSRTCTFLFTKYEKCKCPPDSDNDKNP